MFKNIKNKFKSKDNKTLLSNFFSLSALQMATYLFPLITFPYLVQILGIEIFGILAMATAINMYFKIITDYGFDLSATKEISIHRDNKRKVEEIFNAVMTIKLLLMGVSFLLLSILIFSFEKFSQYWEVYYLTFGLIVGETLLPVWFFHGMEKMKYMTILTILSKTIFTFSIFIFIQGEDDFMMVPLLYAVGAIISGIIGLFIINRQFNVKFYFQPVSVIKLYFKDGWSIFMQRFYVNLHNTTNVVILGLLTNDAIVGLYAIAARLIAIIGDIFKIVSRTYYPYFAKKYAIDPKQSFVNLKKLITYMFMFSTIVMMFMFLLDDWLLHVLTGDRYDVKILNILEVLNLTIIILPFFALFTNVLVAINQGRVLMNIARDTAIISLLLVGPIIYAYEAIGLAYLVLFLQTLIMIRYSSVILEKYKIINEGK